MAQATFTFPAAYGANLVAALGWEFNYQATIPDPNNPGQTIPNPETAQQFAYRMVVQFTKDQIKKYNLYVAQQAQAAANAAVDQTAVTLG